MANTTKVRRTVYRRVNGELTDPREIMVYVRPLCEQYIVINRQKLAVHVDRVSSHLYYDASDIKR